MQAIENKESKRLVGPRVLKKPSENNFKRANFGLNREDLLQGMSKREKKRDTEVQSNKMRTLWNGGRKRRDRRKRKATRRGVLWAEGVM